MTDAPTEASADASADGATEAPETGPAEEHGGVVTATRSRERAPKPARAWRLRSRRELALAIVAVVGVLGTLGFGTAWRHADDHNLASNHAQAAARNFLTALTNFDGRTIDADVHRISTYATGTFAQQLTQFFSADVRAALKENQASSRGEIKDLFVQSNSNGQVRVYGVVDQTIANLKITTPEVDELRLEVGLQQVKGAWRVFDVSVLQGPDAGLSGAGTGTGTSSSPSSTTSP